MTALQVENLTKFYRALFNVKGADAGTVVRIILGILGVKVSAGAKGDAQVADLDVYGLRDVSFEVEKGSVVGITGPSRSGKSTLLRVLAGVVPPTAGRVTRFGTLDHLLSVGDNLNATLTALENIEVSWKRQGLSAAQGRQYRKEVLQFAGLGDFAEIPVKRYSTGMKLRLSMSLVLMSRPDIILLDDVLGVGDLEFQEKCIRELQLLKEAGRTLLLVLNNEDMVAALCTRVIQLQEGRIVADGGPFQLLERAETLVDEFRIDAATQLPERDWIKLVSAGATYVKAETGRSGGGSSINIDFTYRTKWAGLQIRPLIDVEMSGTVVFRSLSPKRIRNDDPQTVRMIVAIPCDILGSGVYNVAINLNGLHQQRTYSLKAKNVVSIQSRGDRKHLDESAGRGLIEPTLDWSIGKNPPGWLSEA